MAFTNRWMPYCGSTSTSRRTWSGMTSISTSHARSVQVAAPAALLGIDVALSLLAGWSWGPWLYGLGGVVVLSILRIRRWLGEGLTLAVALLVVLVFLLERVPLLVWGIVAGTLLAGLGVLLLLPRVGRLLPASAAALASMAASHAW